MKNLLIIASKEDHLDPSEYTWLNCTCSATE